MGFHPLSCLILPYSNRQSLFSCPEFFLKKKVADIFKTVSGHHCIILCRQLSTAEQKIHRKGMQNEISYIIKHCKYIRHAVLKMQDMNGVYLWLK